MTKVFLKTIGLTLAFLCLFFLLTLGVLGYSAWQKWQRFLTTAKVSQTAMVSTVRQALQAPTQTTPQTLLLLGTDELANRGEGVQLTDTMAVVRILPQSGKVVVLSLPRDLWLDAYQTKINALYEYGKERNSGEPTQFVRTVLGDVLGVPIDAVVTLNLSTLADLVDAFGGVDVTIQESFTDAAFPRSDVDVRVVSDPALLYKTVTFTKGVEHMSGERVLEYIRSRHAQSDQGTDTARAERQQQVIRSLIAELQQPRFYLDEERLARLWVLYQTHFATALPPTTVASLAKGLLPVRHQITLVTASLPVYPDNPDGVIYHPKPSAKMQYQWVYSIRTLPEFMQTVQTLLGKDAL